MFGLKSMGTGYLDACKGVCVTGNSFFGGNHPADKEDRPPTPEYGIVYKRLDGCVICANSLYNAAINKVNRSCSMLGKGG